MAISPQAAAALAALLEEEIREVEVFGALLRQEQALLAAAGSADDLVPTVERKTAAITRLKALSDRREQMLRAAGYAAGRAGMEAWLAGAARGDATPSLWLKLLALAAETRQLNETNGKLIALHWQHNQAALATLMAAANRATTYGPDGQQGKPGGGRSFGRA